MQQTSSPNLSQVRQLAIAAAKRGDWSAAVEHNKVLLDANQTDVSALNRIGVAYMQLQKKADAKQAFSAVLEIEKLNPIAKRNLARLKSNGSATVAFTSQYFIEEPGKTKHAELHRLAGKQVLDSLSVGKQCELKLKNRYISVECDGQYVGALPEDLSFRLTKLINWGNTYSCTIRSCSNNSCSVFLKETHRSKKNQDVHSFPPNKSNHNAVSDMDDRFLLLDEDIPVEIVDTDQDYEKSLEDLDSEPTIEE